MIFGATHFNFTVAITHVCQLKNFLYQEFDACMAYVHVLYYWKHVATIETMNKLKQSCSHALLPLQLKGWRYAINMRALIFPCLTRIASCFAASAARSGVTPALMLWASNTTARFSNCPILPQEYTRNDLRSEIQNFLAGGMPPDPLTDVLRTL